MRKPGSLVKIALRENPREKIPLGRHRLLWEDGVKRDAEDLYPDTDWHTLAQNRDGWKQLLCLDV